MSDVRSPKLRSHVRFSLCDTSIAPIRDPWSGRVPLKLWNAVSAPAQAGVGGCELGFSAGFYGSNQCGRLGMVPSSLRSLSLLPLRRQCDPRRWRGMLFLALPPGKRPSAAGGLVEACLSWRLNEARPVDVILQSTGSCDRRLSNFAAWWTLRRLRFGHAVHASEERRRPKGRAEVLKRPQGQFYGRREDLCPTRRRVQAGGG